MSDATQAIRAWAGALGDDRVRADAETLDRYARTTQASATRPCCVLSPLSTEDVQAIVKIASTHGIVVYPISGGKNWGYGDACAPTDGAAIIDLSSMNRILEVNTPLAYCVIEAGVSQKQLYDHLQDNKTGLWMDVTAAGPDSSLVGNTADRGFGHTRYGDHVLSCCGMEVVLADGRVLNTGFGHYPNAQTTHVYRYGLGPFLDGLFSQSNYGIITKIGLWLLPEPECFNFYFFRVQQHADLARLIDRLRPLRMSGVLQTAIHIGNDFRVLAASGRYPWEEAKGQTPLPEDLHQAMRRRGGLGPWQGTGSITGTKAHVRATRKALRKAIGGFATLRFMDDRLMYWAGRVERFLGLFNRGKVLGRMLHTLRQNMALLKGEPVEEPLLGVQWRLRNPPEDEIGDPLDSGCGAYWVSPVLPMEGHHALRVMELVEPLLKQYGFDPNVSFVLLTERALVSIISISFDRSLEEESARASECYEALMDTLLSEGYYVYRCGLQGFPKIRNEDSVFWEVAAQIKRTLDPKDIIARGRYLAPLPTRDDPS